MCTSTPQCHQRKQLSRQWQSSALPFLDSVHEGAVVGVCHRDVFLELSPKRTTRVVSGVRELRGVWGFSGMGNGAAQFPLSGLPGETRLIWFGFLVISRVGTGDLVHLWRRLCSDCVFVLCSYLIFAMVAIPPFTNKRSFLTKF